MPKSRKILVYGAWYGKNFSDNPKYLFLSSQDDKKHKHIWISKNKDVVKELKSKGFLCFYYHSFKGIFYQLRAKTAILCVGYYDMQMEFLPRKNIVQLWHGIPLKKIGYDAWTPGRTQRARDLFFKQNYVLYSSDSYRDIYKSAFGVDDNHLILAGQPRNDVFFNHALLDVKMTDEYKKMFGGKKTILYMPTHRQEGKVEIDIPSIFDLNNLNETLKAKNAVLIIKKHFYHFSENRINGYSNIYELRDEIFDAQFLLSQADILVTDYSSCFIDYLLRDKPILFYQYDYQEYLQNDRELYFDGKDFLPGKTSYSFKDFLLDLQSALNGDDYVSINEKSKSFFFNNECQKASSESILNTIINLK